MFFSLSPAHLSSVFLISVFHFPPLSSWTKERRVLLVKSFEKKKWVVVRPLPFSRTYPQQYDVSLSPSSTPSYLPPVAYTAT